MSLKYDWYQNDQKVVIEVMAKNVVDNPDLVKIMPNCVSLKTANFELNLDLFKSIDPISSNYKVTKFKIEIMLAKIDSSRWESLEVKKEIASEVVPAIKKGPNEWEKLAKDIDKNEETEKEVIKIIQTSILNFHQFNNL